MKVNFEFNNFLSFSSKDFILINFCGDDCCKFLSLSLSHFIFYIFSFPFLFPSLFSFLSRSFIICALFILLYISFALSLSLSSVCLLCLVYFTPNVLMLSLSFFFICVSAVFSLFYSKCPYAFLSLSLSLSLSFYFLHFLFPFSVSFSLAL